MTKIVLVANEFIGLSGNDITHKKLQKLCYFAEVWHYGIWRCTLTFDKFEAWRHGPVNRSLFERHRGFYNINSPILTLDSLSQEKKNLIKAVWEMYGDKTGDELEQISHRELPWRNARKGLEDWEPSTVQLKEADLLNLGVKYVSDYKQRNHIKNGAED